MSYNGWKNKETWLVNIWYTSDMPSVFSNCERYHVEPFELADEVETLAYADAESQLNAGLLSDFVSTCWAEVDWHELADRMNETLAEMKEETTEGAVQ